MDTKTKTKQLTELFEENQQPFQLSADVDNFGDELVTKQEKGEVEEEEEEEKEEDTQQPKVHQTSFQLGSGRRQDRHLDVVGNESIIVSKRSPFRKITFTLNCWVHLMSYLNDIDTVVRSLDYAIDENNGRHRFVSRKHLRDGYYARVLFGLCCVDFRKYYVPYGYKVFQIRPSTNGISIRIDEWEDLIEFVVPAINERFPQWKTMYLWRQSFGTIRIASLFFMLSLWSRRLLLLGLDYIYRQFWRCIGNFSLVVNKQLSLRSNLDSRALFDSLLFDIT